MSKEEQKYSRRRGPGPERPEENHGEGRRSVRYIPRYAKPGDAKRRRKDAVIWSFILFFSALFLTAAIWLGAEVVMLSKAENDFDRLAEMVADDPLPTSSTDSEPGGTTAATVGSSPAGEEEMSPDLPDAGTEATEPAEKTVQPKYAQLYLKNSDLFGWIKIDGTEINYPVMHSPQDPQRYIHANFAGEYSRPGIPFLDAACTGDSDNLLIYGHNMRNGTMFHSLLEYRDKAYWESHPVIQLDTLYEEQKYEVMFAFYDRIYSRNETAFRFYRFIEAEDREDFAYALEKMKSKQLYETGVAADYGDQLLTLVTCSYHTGNGRFVVVAKKVS